MEVGNPGGSSITPRNAPRSSPLRKWKGKCKGSLYPLGYTSVDAFMNDIRGR